MASDAEAILSHPRPADSQRLTTTVDRLRTSVPFALLWLGAFVYAAIVLAELHLFDNDYDWINQAQDTGWIQIVAVATAAMIIGITILVDVPRLRLTQLGLFVARVDIARVAIAASDRLTQYATELVVTNLDTIAEELILADAVIRQKATQQEVHVA